MPTKHADAHDLTPSFTVGPYSAVAERRVHTGLRAFMWGFAAVLGLCSTLLLARDAHAASPLDNADFSVPLTNVSVHFHNINTGEPFLQWTATSGGSVPSGGPWWLYMTTQTFGYDLNEIVAVNGTQVASCNFGGSPFANPDPSWQHSNTGCSGFSWSSGDVITVGFDSIFSGVLVELGGSASSPVGAICPTGSAYCASSSAVAAMAFSGASPPAPSGPTDPIGTTGVVRINAPALASTTTSPVSVNFDYTLASSTAFYDASTSALVGRSDIYQYYRLRFTNPDTGVVYDRYGLLSATSTAGTFNQSTTTALTGDGTWQLVASLAGNNNDGLGFFAATRAAQTYFGLNALTNTAVYQQFVPQQQSAYASSSCAISFTGSFDLPQCLGYLVVPSTGSSTPLGMLESLSLAHTFPFAYAYQLGDLRNLLFTSSSTATTTISVVVGTSTSA